MPWRVVDHPPYSCFAMKCCVCHIGPESRDLWVDGDIEVEGEGTYMICALCIVEAARLLGMVDKDQGAAALARIEALTIQLAAADARLAEADTVIQALRRYDAGNAAAPSVDDGAEVSSPTSAPSVSDEERLAAVDAELAEPVLPARCPAGCGKPFLSERGAEHHADLKHKGWRDAK